MIKLFGYNILKDWELKQREENHWEKIKKYLKIKKLWHIDYHWEKKPKCSACDEERKLTIQMPDGSTKRISCSCDKTLTIMEVAPLDKELPIIAVKGETIYMADGFSEWAINDRIIFNQSELHTTEEHLDRCFFTSEKLAKQALKIIKENENN